MKKNPILIGNLALPIGLLILFFLFYNFGKITPPEMIKTSGLLSISLLSITLFVGPLCRIFPGLDFLKGHRKFWGILAFVVALVHMGLVYIFRFNFDITPFFDANSPQFTGILSGLAAVLILCVIVLTSTKDMIAQFGFKTWKTIQTMSYISLVLALTHFYLMESTNGVLVIRRSLGRIVFGFAITAIVARIAILLSPRRK